MLCCVEPLLLFMDPYHPHRLHAGLADWLGWRIDSVNVIRSRAAGWLGATVTSHSCSVVNNSHQHSSRDLGRIHAMPDMNVSRRNNCGVQVEIVSQVGILIPTYPPTVVQLFARWRVSVSVGSFLFILHCCVFSVFLYSRTNGKNVLCNGALILFSLDVDMVVRGKYMRIGWTEIKSWKARSRSMTWASWLFYVWEEWKEFASKLFVWH